VTTVEIRPLTADDDLDAQIDLSERAFGLMSPAARDNWKRIAVTRLAGDRFLGAFVDGRPAGGAAYWDMRQWWAGRDVPMAGVATVRVAPEARGRGLGRQLMTELLRLVAEHGYPLSALYPATMPIYRSLGWELAGGRYHAMIPPHALRSLISPDGSLGRAAGDLPELARVGSGDAEHVNGVIGRAHESSRDCGPLTWSRDVTAYWLGLPDVYRYACDDGFISYQWRDGNDAMFIDRAVAASPAATRALWSLLAGHALNTAAFEVCTSPDDPLWWLTRERDVKLTKRSMWMLRVVDVRAAIRGRGFPPGVTVSAALAVIDDGVPSNTGAWELAIDDGKGRLERIADSPGAAPASALTVGARGLAALYAGTPVPTLRHAGLAAGGVPADDAAICAAFTGTSYMLDDF
jgi:predicted acetyltransferase